MVALKYGKSSHNKGIFKVKTIKTKSELNTDKNGSKISSVIPKELSITNDIEIKKGAGIFLHSREYSIHHTEIVQMILGMLFFIHI